MFRFTIRDVLWLTVVVALSIGLWLEQRQTSMLRREITGLRQGKEWDGRVFTELKNELQKEGRNIRIGKDGRIRFVKRAVVSSD
jgi:hypothetical protein